MNLLKRINEQANNINVKNRNSISNLDPCLVQEGIIGVGGGIDRSDIIDERKHPVILPKARYPDYLNYSVIKRQGSQEEK